MEHRRTASPSLPTGPPLPSRPADLPQLQRDWPWEGGAAHRSLSQVISEPADQAAYTAGEDIEVLVFTNAPPVAGNRFPDHPAAGRRQRSTGQTRHDWRQRSDSHARIQWSLQ